MLQLNVEEYEQLIPKVMEHIKISLARANREGKIYEYLKKIDYPLENLPNQESEKIKKKILVIGYRNGVNIRDLLSVASQKGFSDNDFDFELSNPDKYDYSTLKNSKKYDYVLVGPMAHNQKGKGKSSSMIREMEENDDIFPPVIRILDKKNKLNITISSFERALSEIIDFC